MRDEKEGRKKQATCTCVYTCTCTTLTEKFGCNNIIHYSTCIYFKCITNFSSFFLSLSLSLPLCSSPLVPVRVAAAVLVCM